MNETQLIKISRLELNKGQIPGLPGNPRQWTQADVNRLAQSLKDTPELFEARPIIAVPHDGKLVILGGNMRYCASKYNGAKEVPVFVLPEDTPAEKLKEIVIKDNGTFGAWDFDLLANEWDDLPLATWGVPAWNTEDEPEMTESEIERKEREFRERMAAGEISEEDEEYQAFLEKFKLKKTTDDCYTPPVVYDAVADWVAQEYGVKRETFVRPFYPGGDYQKETYPDGCVVVDNPPFSILAEILKFYHERGVHFFLFAPTLTLFSSSSYCCALPTGVAVTYENGASVNTSFLTDLEGWRLRSAPTLYKAVKEANDENLREMHKELPHPIRGRALASGRGLPGAGEGEPADLRARGSEGGGQGHLRQGLHRKRAGICRAREGRKGGRERERERERENGPSIRLGTE